MLRLISEKQGKEEYFMGDGASSYRRFLSGDDYAIGEIIDEYKDGLILYVSTISGNFSIAEEIVEETFVRIAIKQPAFSGKSSFKTWLYSIAKYTAVDYMRKHKPFSFVSFQDCTETSDMTDIENQLIKCEQKKMLHRAMGTLKRDYRQVLHLSFFEDMNNSDIADIMGKSNRQVENLIYNAKKSLKAKLEKEGFRYDEF